MEHQIPPGFRFFPTEEELVSFYLHNKLEACRPDIQRVIPVIDIYNFEPWQLPQVSGELCRGDTEQWFFFSARQEREARGGRPNRTTASGYWKATGSPSHVYSSDNQVIGLKKTMVFYSGKAPTGRKTKWKMNEYRAIKEDNANSTCSLRLRHEFCLCRVYVISGTFRAFDRRPATRVIGDASFDQYAQPDMTVPSSQNVITPGETTCSTATNSSTSAANHFDLQLTAASFNQETVNSMETCWDWEELNWV